MIQAGEGKTAHLAIEDGLGWTLVDTGPALGTFTGIDGIGLPYHYGFFHRTNIQTTPTAITGLGNDQHLFLLTAHNTSHLSAASTNRMPVQLQVQGQYIQDHGFKIEKGKMKRGKIGI